MGEHVEQPSTWEKLLRQDRGERMERIVLGWDLASEGDFTVEMERRPDGTFVSRSIGVQP